MTTYYMNFKNKIWNKCIIVLCIFHSFVNFSTLSQEHIHGSTCGSPELSAHTSVVSQKIEALEQDVQFLNQFRSRYHFDYPSFVDVNGYFVHSFRSSIAIKTFGEQSISFDRIKDLLFELIDEAASRDDLWFETPADHGTDKIYHGKNGFNPIPKGDGGSNNIPKTLLCSNAGFENNNWSGWETICAEATNTSLVVTSLQPYTPPANCTSPSGSPPQHSLWTTGTDAIGGFSRVFNGGVSAMIGNGPQANNPQWQAAVLRKTFVVDPSNPIITYSYAAVLNDGGHTAGQQPFFNVRVLIDGAPYSCAAYSATAGDGQAGWVYKGRYLQGNPDSGGTPVYARDWTTIAVPLHNYIGSTVVLEFSVSDCSLDLGSHWAYAYVDVSCDNMEVERFCQGGSTVLSAPSNGIIAYEWNTGETTQQITITTPGLYSVYVQPYGSPCSALLTYNASLYPVPTADFSVDHNSVCAGGSIEFTNLSAVEPGGTITSYQWSYGDGINTPASPGGPITGVAQTTGSYETTNEHVYNVLGNQNVTLSIQTSDGCTDTHQSTVSIIQGPQATISGSTVVCAGAAPPPEVTFTGTLTPGPFTFTYNIGGGPDQTITTTSGTSVTLPVPTNPPGSYTYNITHISDPISPTCQNDVTGSVTIVVNPLPTAVIGTDATVCEGDAAPVITFTGSNAAPGSNYQFTYSINGDPNQTITTSGTNTATINVSTATPDTYTYTLISVQDVATGCSQAVSAPGNVAVVTVNPLPVATTSGTATVCQNSSDHGVVFTGTNPTGQYTFTYTVNGGPNQVVSTIPGSNSITVYQSTATPGTYIYNLVNVAFQGTGCNQVVNLTETVTVRQLPIASISLPDEACHNDPVSPTVVFTGSNGDTPYTFTYNINGSPSQTVISSGSTYTIQVPTNVVGNFNYTLTNVQEGSIYGCQQIQNLSTLITIHALPNVTAGNDFTVCAGDEIVLTGGGAISYQWDNNVQNGVPFTSNDTTTYTVTGTDINGCRNTDQVTVNVVPIPQMNFTGINLTGCAPVVPVFTNYSTGNLTNCTWYIGNGQILQGCGVVSTQFNDPGCFDVTLVVSTPEGCSNTMTRTDYVCVNSNPVADFYPNPSELSTYQWESEMVNESTGATQYIWDFGDGSPLNYQVSPTHEFPNEGGAVYTITLVAMTDAGCTDTAFATVNIKDELIFYVPNTFTPDGDAFNEVFKPVFTAGYDPYNYSLYIYNRWGEMVFESHDANVGWNGRYGVDGNVCQDGTYTWKIEIKRKSNDERKMYVGHVSIIR